MYGTCRYSTSSSPIWLIWENCSKLGFSSLPKKWWSSCHPGWLIQGYPTKIERPHRTSPKMAGQQGEQTNKMANVNGASQHHLSRTDQRWCRNTEKQVKLTSPTPDLDMDSYSKIKGDAGGWNVKILRGSSKSRRCIDVRVLLRPVVRASDSQSSPTTPQGPDVPANMHPSGYPEPAHGIWWTTRFFSVTKTDQYIDGNVGRFFFWVGHMIRKFIAA